MPCICTTVDTFTESDHQLGLLAQDPFTDAYATRHYQPRLPLRPTHLSIDLSFDIPNRSARGHVTHTARAQWSGANTLHLNAEDFEDISVSSPDDDRLSFTYDGHVVQIVFSVPLLKDQVVTVCVNYAVTDPIDGLVFSRGKDGHFVVSDHETERARYWLPVVDHPTVRTTLSFTLRTLAADQLVALANGYLVSEDTSTDGVKVTKWEMKQITPSYLICIAIGKFIVANGGEHRGKKIRYFAPISGRRSYTVEDLALTFGRTKEMIEFMENKVNFELPWPKYYQWACGEVGGAMENSSLVSYDEWYILDERSTTERAHRVDSTVVHELAHTWFGDMVVCSDFCHSFLKESFATLISAEWYHFKNGNDDFQYTLTKYAEASFAETTEYMRPIVTRSYETSWSVFDRHLYTNGAWRLHMLRVKLGNDRFWSAVSAYLHKRCWKTVETDDFRKDLEEYSGEQLCSYFEQWFYGKGHPVLEASFSYDSSKGSHATISVKQVQEEEERGIGLFDLTVEVAFETVPGTWETHRIAMESGAASGQLIVKLSTRPLQVVVDPQKKLLYNLTKFSGVGEDMCIRSLAHAPTFAGRFQAAKLLQEFGSRRASAALRQALKKEGHWGLREIIARDLGKGGRLDSLPVLIDVAFSEPDARVVPTVLRAISEYRVASAEEALHKFAVEGHEMKKPYGAIGAAIRGLGKMRDIKHLDLITNFLEDCKKVGIGFEIQMGAAAALGYLRDWKAVEVLMRNLDAPNDTLPPRVKCALIYAIGEAVTWEGAALRVKAFEFVEKVCKSDEVKSVRMAAGFVLASLGDVGDAESALEQLEKRVENQGKPSVRKMRVEARRAANGKEGGIRAMGSMIEKLQSELAEMKAKLDDVQSKLEMKECDKKGVDGSAVQGEDQTETKV